MINAKMRTAGVEGSGLPGTRSRCRLEFEPASICGTSAKTAFDPPLSFLVDCTSPRRTISQTELERDNSMKRTATATWNGSLTEGAGTLDMQSGAFTAQPYTFKGRFVDESGRSGTNPEELIAAAHAGCFAMQLAHFLAENNTPPETLKVTAAVELIPGTGITGSALTLEAKVPGIDQEKFAELAHKAKGACPVSKALGAINVTLDARLG